MITFFSMMVAGLAWDGRLDKGHFCRCKAAVDKECLIDKTDQFVDGPHEFVLLRDFKTKKPATGWVKLSCEKK